MFLLAYFGVSREAVFLDRLKKKSNRRFSGFRIAAIYSCRGDHIAVSSLVSKLWKASSYTQLLRRAG